MRGVNTEHHETGLAIIGSCALAAAIILTAVGDPSELGAPGYWAWALTGLQVVALRAAATGKHWGWLLGASVQLPWIAYAMVTAQFGFIPGCLVSGLVQTHGYWRRQPASPHTEKASYA
jgi:hypothetical protein